MHAHRAEPVEVMTRSRPACALAVLLGAALVGGCQASVTTTIDVDAARADRIVVALDADASAATAPVLADAIETIARRGGVPVGDVEVSEDAGTYRFALPASDDRDTSLTGVGAVAFSDEPDGTLRIDIELVALDGLYAALDEAAEGDAALAATLRSGIELAVDIAGAEIVASDMTDGVTLQVSADRVVGRTDTWAPGTLTLFVAPGGESRRWMLIGALIVVAAAVLLIGRARSTMTDAPPATQTGP